MKTLLNGTKMITVGVCIDGDGHFHVIPIENRIAMMKAIKLIEDGDYYKNNKRNWPEPEEDLELMEESRWISYLHSFTQRGRFEITQLYL